MKCHTSVENDVQWNPGYVKKSGCYVTTLNHQNLVKKSAQSVLEISPQAASELSHIISHGHLMAVRLLISQLKVLRSMLASKVEVVSSSGNQPQKSLHQTLLMEFTIAALSRRCCFSKGWTSKSHATYPWEGRQWCDHLCKAWSVAAGGPRGVNGLVCVLRLCQLINMKEITYKGAFGKGMDIH